MKSVCLAILNYNGRKHLEHLLPTAIAAAQKFLGSCAVLVLDNRSTDPDVEWVKREFPSVRAVVAPENDFLFSYNWLLPQLQNDVVVLLNNDLRVDEHFLEPLIRHFDDHGLARRGALIQRLGQLRFQAAQRDGLDGHGIPRLPQSVCCRPFGRR